MLAIRPETEINWYDWEEVMGAKTRRKKAEKMDEDGRRWTKMEKDGKRGCEFSETHIVGLH